MKSGIFSIVLSQKLMMLLSKIWLVFWWHIILWAQRWYIGKETIIAVIIISLSCFFIYEISKKKIIEFDCDFLAIHRGCLLLSKIFLDSTHVAWNQIEVVVCKNVKFFKVFHLSNENCILGNLLHNCWMARERSQ